MTKKPYRQGVGIMLLNAKGQVFAGQRLDSVVEAWQMPQGGLDPGETPLAAAWRELEEETGVQPHLAALIREAERDFTYDFPADLAASLWNGRYAGQSQRWFAFRFLGKDGDINIATKEPEFRDWQWVDRSDLAGLIVPFKRPLYDAVIAAFSDIA
ncbi:MAG: RNA pyrophosphohydrolase [Sphingopyxis sp.]|jgi:putative (di)nucleoside polyphosphate hydrolase|nr:RNA pyrophosphohydrolase [Sphingopyxis sp.]